VFQRVAEILPQFMIDELIQVAKVRRDWVHYIPLEDHSYKSRCVVHTWLEDCVMKGQDAFAMWAASLWLVDGPKIFRPTREQCFALEQIEVNLSFEDFSMPYPTLMVDLPKDLYSPYECCLVHKDKDILTFCTTSRDHAHDIVTTIHHGTLNLEEPFRKYDEDCEDFESVATTRAIRVAANSCLALSNYGWHKKYLYPKDVQQDNWYAKSDDDRGKRARKRLETALELVTFSQEVKLHDISSRVSEPGEPTGMYKSPHWRRGHWAMQAWGPGHSLRKRILRKPVLVRKDLFMGDLSLTETNYQG
jgi:hypothetical protein